MLQPNVATRLGRGAHTPVTISKRCGVPLYVLLVSRGTGEQAQSPAAEAGCLGENGVQSGIELSLARSHVELAGGVVIRPPKVPNLLLPFKDRRFR